NVVQTENDEHQKCLEDKASIQDEIRKLDQSIGRHSVKLDRQRAELAWLTGISELKVNQPSPARSEPAGKSDLSGKRNVDYINLPNRREPSDDIISHRSSSDKHGTIVLSNNPERNFTELHHFTPVMEKIEFMQTRSCDSLSELASTNASISLSGNADVNALSGVSGSFIDQPRNKQQVTSDPKQTMKPRTNPLVVPVTFPDESCFDVGYEYYEEIERHACSRPRQLTFPGNYRVISNPERSDFPAGSDRAGEGWLTFSSEIPVNQASSARCRSSLTECLPMD
ncbi:hypothetical protein AHF37_09044, partial [Paragonimus kellicotti]